MGLRKKGNDQLLNGSFKMNVLNCFLLSTFWVFYLQSMNAQKKKKKKQLKADSYPSAITRKSQNSNLVTRESWWSIWNWNLKWIEIRTS